ncbi:MAG: LamG-like jellyroll fold domain-containing protein [Gammaproteobacteria bacterium]
MSQSTGLLGAYSFDEGVGSIAGDASGNSHTGTVTGATWTTVGKYGGTLNFDGTNDLVTVADSAALDLTTGMTLSAWVHPTALSTWRTVLLKERSGGLVYALYASDQASHPNTYVNIGGSDLGSTGPTALTLNGWSNLAATYDGSVLRVYINGVQVSSRPVAGSLLSSTGALRIGGNSVWGEYFQGLIDEVRIYDRALAATEIQADMVRPIGLAPPPPPPPGGSTVGQWSDPVELGMVAVNMVQLHTGKILMYRGENSGGTSATLWDPLTGAFKAAPAPYNVFCSGHSSLADGRILVVGGHDNAGGILGANESAIFDPMTEAWTSTPSMAYRRWYPSATTLPDGRVLATSGGTTCFDCYADVPEIYNPQTNLWTQLTGAKLGFPYYPFIFVLPDGRILNAGAGELPAPTRILDLVSQRWTTVDDALIDGGSAVMYRPGKVLKAGTAATTDVSNDATAATTHVLDMTAQSPAWRQTASMAFPRAYHTLSVLPDGNVLVTGGGVTTEGKDVSAAVYEAELWSPTTETWQTMAAMQSPRLYHSTALLLPDGRVVVAGSGDSYGGPNQTTAEFYSPPYLFKGDRPVIASAPSQVAYADGFTVSLVDTSTIKSVALVRPGAVTHQFDENQRYLSLGFQQNANTLSVDAPGNGNLAPPGYYMLFVLNEAGVPSVASWIRMLPATADTTPPEQPSGLTGTSSNSGVFLNWTANTEADLAGYDVYRGPNGSGSFTRLNNALVTNAQFDDTLAPNGILDYTVTAVDRDGNESPQATPAVTVTMAKTNRVLNPGFELDANNNTQPDNWSASTRFTHSNVLARSGTYSGRHLATNNPNYTITQVVTGLTATTYTFAGWVNIPATADAFTLTVRVRWRNASNAILRRDNVKVYTASTSKWDKALRNMVAPSGTSNAQVQMVVSSLNATIYVDDFALR